MSVESRDTSTSASLFDEIACKTAGRSFAHQFCRASGVNGSYFTLDVPPVHRNQFERRTACCVVMPKARDGCAAKRRQSPRRSNGVRNGSHAVTRSRPPAGNAARCFFFARGASRKAPAAHEQAERPPVT